MSGLHLYRAARVEALAAALAANLTQFQPLNPFAPLTISVGNKGMERWLRSVLAVHLGIAANLKFPFPRGAVTSLLAMQEAEDEPWQRDALAWRVLTAMDTLQDDTALQPLVQWLQAQPGVDQTPSGALQRSRWTLATEIASVLDRVAVYRPDWLQAWSQGTAVPEQDAAGIPAWQPALWRALQDQVAGRHPSLRLLAAEPQAGDALHVFAVSSLPRVWLETLRRAAQLRDVFVYHLTPSDLYWGEYRTLAELRRQRPDQQVQTRNDQHPLLTALGKVSRDHMEMLLDGNVQDHPVAAGFDVAQQDTALATLQGDLIAARPLAELAEQRPDRTLQPGDDSLQFHACHGPSRQVEVLRDVLLQLLQDHPALQYRDIVVMTPDVATFAPLVKAVLGDGYSSPHKDDWGPSGGPKLPVYVADLGLRDLNPLADGLLRVLALAGGRLTASALAELVACPAVMLRFGLGDDDVPLIRDWLRQAGARLGADASDRHSQGLPTQHTYTLAFALQRLALGLAMADDGDVDLAGLGPLDEMEGESRAVFGRFASLCGQLLYWRTELARPRPMAQWLDSLVTLAEVMTATSQQAAFLRAELYEGLQALVTESAGWSGDVALDALQLMLQARFERGRGGDRPVVGAVTLCALTPMRSVPFQVVCLLGMDDSTFPRPVVRRGFDAVAANPRAGDQDPREDDRNLLLEALLSARSHLVVLYSGRDAQTGRPLAPAVPIGDLLDTVDATFSVPPGLTPADRPASAQPVRPRDCLTYQHSVQPFSPSGFGPLPDQPWSPRPARFDRRMHQAAALLLQPRQPQPPLLQPDSQLPERTLPDQLSVTDLLRWLRQPVRQLLQSGLGIYLKEADDALADREPLELDTLQAWNLKAKLARRWRDPALSATDLQRQLLGRAALPPGTPGQVLVNEWTELLLACRREVGELAPPQHHKIALRVEAPRGPLYLTGTVQTDGDRLLDLQLEAADKPRRLLQAWVELVVCNAMQPQSVKLAVVVGVASDKPKVLALQPPADPVAALQVLVGLVQEAWVGPIRLCEKTSFAYAAGYYKAKGDDAAKRATALAKAVATWSESFGGGNEADDPGLAQVFVAPPFGDTDGAVHPEFERLALALWLPILQAQHAVGGRAGKEVGP